MEDQKEYEMEKESKVILQCRKVYVQDKFDLK